MESQIEPTEQIRSLVADVSFPVTPERLMEIKKEMYRRLEIRPYNDATKDHEKSIRWKRTAGEILNDGYVYNGKACTDLVVLFLSLCLALGLNTRFVKLKKEKMIHSVAEIKLEDGWYIFDIAHQNDVPTKGEITEGAPYGEWKLWKKGRDAWDLGLTDFNTITQIN